MNNAPLAVVLLASIGLLGACAPAGTERPGTAAAEAVPKPSEAATIDAAVEASLLDLYRAAPGSQALVEKAKGVLVFPSITKAGFVAGAEYGKGALQVGGQTVGYYSLTAGSIGFTAGVQETAQAILFNTQESLDAFRASNGWTAGVDTSVALLKIGGSGTIDSRTANSPVQAIIYNTSGLMADASVQGQKITKITP
ncbi:MAG TPA: YSC84-related protein [Geminicoccus sp.]|jgi:lipid-binding SYLF domain-containing protein|uniref:BPSL1445 family SYLF domain-containing lipoprotein n=1 Tax=Geminicoccus sp. TaxID=2024832 RepID=UPI002E35EEB3|nr:YSC84-related protein [Geminicoccus sp.]HEX2527709.1 YSC84-related protein [Geminicoccus sp.]